MRTLVVAEKPSVASNIALVLGATNRSDAYFEGNGFIVSWCFGHLLTLKDSKDYDPSMEKWDLNKFPFIPSSFEYKVKDDSGVKKQFKTLSKLMNEADLIINACDADREGETIFYLVYRESKSRKPVKRLWLSEQTPEDIKQGMANLIDNSKMTNLQAAGEARQIADWLIGINLTSVATLKFGNGTLLRCGRVILPTLKLIYDRHMEIVNFKPTPFYELKACFKSQNGTYNGFLIRDNTCTRFDKKEDLEGILERIKGKCGKVISKNVKPLKENPKKLFNLTDLQGYITSKYDGWSADKVLNVAQSLYEKKLLSYPRTSSRYLESTLVSKMEKVLDAIKGDWPVKFENKKSVFDSSKVESHSAITPTYIIPSSLSEDEKIVYEEVKKRFLAQFMEPAEYEITEIVTFVDSYSFLTKGRVLVREGWKALYLNEQDDIVDEEIVSIPEILENETVNIEDISLLSKKTSPPKLFSEETLLKAMETCGRDISEDDIQHILEGFQLGTPATRAQILKNIFSVGYAEKKGKSIYLSPIGLSLIQKVPLDKFYDINFTGILEKKLKDIELGKVSKDSYIEEIKGIVIESVDKLKNVNAVVSIKEEKECLGKCPECGSAVFESEKNYYCSDFKNGCKFTIWKENAFLSKFGIKKVQKNLMKKLLEVKTTQINLNNSKFIIVSLVKNNDKWCLDFKLPTDEECEEMREALGKCPECGANVYENSYSYACVRKNSGDCNFSIYKENALLSKFNIKKVPKVLMKNLLNKSVAQIKLSYSKFANAKLEKQGDRWIINFDFMSEDENLKLREVLGKCPECGANVYEDNYSFKCSNYSNGCSFSLWKENKFFEKYRKKLSKSIVKVLLEHGKVEIKDFYSEKKLKTFGAVVGLEKSGDYWNFKFISFIN
jgi:DNA topoisomerase-3